LSQGLKEIVHPKNVNVLILNVLIFSSEELKRIKQSELSL